ncbi:SIS domain-containing protein [Nostoc sp. CHAB 5784]|uniref:6-phospho-3-hexuloisomerase n=1 Tax=Nostoc mirabile TaxID=2907820 RepID=UPI001E2C9053|nr:6-phospho-3-hexuloisomerase [Nostoc mirabile]MCC5668859.1 SIS domain-containing protein [Nostoc mirabile CHAB5784]
MAQIYQSPFDNTTVITTTLKQNLTQAIELVLEENKQVLEKISYSAIERFMEEITGAERIFVTGEGRSGLVIRMVAMRLIHLGYQINVLSDTTISSLKKGDLLIAFSGSGSTSSVTIMAAKVKKIDAHLVAVTTQPESVLGKMADVLIEIKAAAKQSNTNQQSKQFSDSLFEQSTLFLFDAIFHVLADNWNNSADRMLALDANIE